MNPESAVAPGRARLAAGLTATALAVGLTAAGQPAYASPTPGTAERPERGIAVYTEYSQIVIPVGEQVRMDLTVQNTGRRDENVAVRLTGVPKGWTAAIKGGQFEVGGVPVVAEKSRTLTFTAQPAKGLGPGTYTFTIEGTAADHALTSSEKLVVVTEPRKETKQSSLRITTSYPVLRGPTDSSFEFSLEVSNKSDSDQVVNLAADAPKDWDVSFKPAYESKQITSLRIRAGASQTVALDLKAPRDARAGAYPVVFHASTDQGQADTALQVVLTGIYQLDAVTPDGRLSMDAVIGRPSVTTLVVRNTGSAVNHAIKLSAFSPENWKVQFKPDTIDSLAPGAIQQVEATVTPAAQALAGDYSVTMNVDGEKASKTVEMRVSVHPSTVWGWAGVGVIAVVIGGLGGLFTWLGRR